jgi:hypothetical protein
MRRGCQYAAVYLHGFGVRRRARVLGACGELLQLARAITSSRSVVLEPGALLLVSADRRVREEMVRSQQSPVVAWTLRAALHRPRMMTGLAVQLSVLTVC